ncbi:MAG: hypothetical protein IID45_02050 [Planctomycetes bacterium]|nr:hypothetical protein [Planctomycetota bacterium]
MTKSQKTQTLETEEELVTQAQRAVSQCNWTVGECAVKWTRKYAKGRTDADFAALVGLSADQIFQRRRVSETFADVRAGFALLKWSHFYAATRWDDAAECLQWADENEATVAEMKAYRRALHGEDLTTDADPEPDDFAGDPAVAFVPDEPSVVRDPADFGRDSRTRDASRSPGAAAAVVGGVARGGDDGYSPFRSGAGSPAPTAVAESPSSGTAVKPPLSPEATIKRMTTSLERINKALAPEFLAAFDNLPQKLRDRFTRAVAELSSKAARLL